MSRHSRLLIVSLILCLAPAATVVAQAPPRDLPPRVVQVPNNRREAQAAPGVVEQLAEELGAGIGAQFARDNIDFPLQGRPWGPEQVVGPPNTFRAGDIQTAWASLSEDGQQEWLELSYARDVVPTQVEIHETFNPGAVHKVTMFDQGGKEIVLWQGDVQVGLVGKRVLKIPVKSEKVCSRIRVYLDSPKIAGWNEIDAVGLLGRDDQLQWATKVTSSSTFADQPIALPQGVRFQGPVVVDPFGGMPRRARLDPQMKQQAQERERQMAALVKRLRFKDKQMVDQAEQFAAEKGKLLGEIKRLTEAKKRLEAENLRLRESPEPN